MSSISTDAPDSALAIERYRRLAAHYDASCRFSRGIRRRALELLAPREGETVFDIGCGTGALLGEIAERVGCGGCAVGVEQSPEMAAIARQRVSSPQTRVIVAPVEQAQPGRPADAILFCFAHDVLQSAQALANVFAHAKPGARVVLAGSKLASGWWSAPLNVWKKRRLAPYLTTWRGMERPWEPVLAYCPDLQVLENWYLDTAYVAAGTFDPGQPAAGRRSNITQ